MNEQRDFARSVSGWLVERAGNNTPGYLDEVLARTQRTRQRPAWSSLERWLPVQTTLRLVPVPRMAWLVLVIGLVAALAVAYVVGTRPRHVPSLFGPARNGAIVYGGSDGDIHSLDAASGATTLLVAGTARDTAPLLSPDGMSFLFLRDAVVDPATDGKSGTIIVAKVDGSNARALTGKLDNIQDTAWSHDGSRVVVSSDQAGKAALTVFSVDGATGPVTLDIHGMTANYIAVRPGDNEVTFRGGGVDSTGETEGLFAVGMNGHGLRTILAKCGCDFGILSPDGSKLAYQVWDGTNGSLHVVDVVTGHDLTPAFDPPPGSGVIDDAPAWSPDGSQLLFRRYHGSPTYRLAVTQLSGGLVREIGPARSVSATDFQQFSPDGKEILAFYTSGPSTWLLDPTGVAADRQLPTDMVDRAAWQRLAP